MGAVNREVAAHALDAIGVQHGNNPLSEASKIVEWVNKSAIYCYLYSSFSFELFLIPLPSFQHLRNNFFSATSSVVFKLQDTILPNMFVEGQAKL